MSKSFKCKKDKECFLRIYNLTSREVQIIQMTMYKECYKVHAADALMNPGSGIIIAFQV